MWMGRIVNRQGMCATPSRGVNRLIGTHTHTHTHHHHHHRRHHLCPWNVVQASSSKALSISAAAPVAHPPPIPWQTALFKLFTSDASRGRFQPLWWYLDLCAPAGMHGPISAEHMIIGYLQVRALPQVGHQQGMLGISRACGYTLPANACTSEGWASAGHMIKGYMQVRALPQVGHQLRTCSAFWSTSAFRAFFAGVVLFQEACSVTCAPLAPDLSAAGQMGASCMPD
eukprot:320493-Pelagomonas_calceolata.AAC.3